MKKDFVIGILLLFLCFGCGSRKVELNKSTTENKTTESEVVKNDVSTNTNVKIETNIKTVDSTNEVIEETIIQADDKSKPAISEGKELGNTIITKRKTTRNKTTSFFNNTNTSLNEKIADKTTKNSKKTQQSKTNQQTKNVDRKQFDIVAGIIQYWWLILLIALLVYLYKKYKSFIF